MASISSKSATTLINKLKYNGKEEQRQEFSDGTGLEWLDYGARMYDAQVGRFFTQDRFAEKYFILTPYQYGANNPIALKDINGDSLNVATQYRDEMNQALGAAFGERASKFSYNENGNLVYNGSKKDFKEKERRVFKGLSKAMNEKTTTHVVFESSYTIVDKDGNRNTINTADYGGAVTALASEN